MVPIVVRTSALVPPWHRAGNRDYKLYLEVKARFEAFTMLKTVIDTDQHLEVCVTQALAALR